MELALLLFHKSGGGSAGKTHTVGGGWNHPEAFSSPRPGSGLGGVGGRAQLGPHVESPCSWGFLTTWQPQGSPGDTGDAGRCLLTSLNTVQSDLCHAPLIEAVTGRPG